MTHVSTRRRIAPLGALLLAVVTSRGYAQVDTVAAAAEIGITAEALVACDLEEHASTILMRIQLATDLRTVLALTRGQEDAASVQLTILSQSLHDSDDDQDLAAAHAAALATLQLHRAQIETTRAELFAEATSGLPPAEISALISWQAAASRRVPPEFRVLNRTSAEWRAIEKAVRAELHSLRTNEPLAPQHATVLTEARNNVEVVAALQRLALYLPAVQQTFQDYVSAP